MNQTNEWLEGKLSYEGQKLLDELLEKPDMDFMIADTLVRCPKDIYDRISKERQEGKLKPTFAEGGVLKTGRVEPIEKIVDNDKKEE